MNYLPDYRRINIVKVKVTCLCVHHCGDELILATGGARGDRRPRAAKRYEQWQFLFENGETQKHNKNHTQQKTPQQMRLDLNILVLRVVGIGPKAKWCWCLIVARLKYYKPDLSCAKDTSARKSRYVFRGTEDGNKVEISTRNGNIAKPFRVFACRSQEEITIRS